MTRQLEATLWSMAAVMIVAAVSVIDRPIAVDATTPATAHADRIGVSDSTEARRDARTIIAGDPFRFDRAPASVAFALAPAAPGTTATVAPPRQVPALA